MTESPNDRTTPDQEGVGRAGAVRVYSLVEKGWAAARRVSITLAQQGVAVHHLVKGRLAPELLAVLTPYPAMTIQGLAPRTYRLQIFLRLLGALACRRSALVLVDNQRAARWVARWFPSLAEAAFLVEEQADGSPRVVWRGRRVPPAWGAGN